MSDITIPGVTSKVNSSEMIKALVEAESIPLERMEERVSEFKTEKKVWQDLNLKLGKLRDSARTLFGFENPFNDRIANSSSPSVLTATTSRQAAETVSNILVKQTAAADRFLSASLSPDFTVEEGRYTFTVGEESVSFTYSGGSLRDFAEKVTAKSNGLLKASVVNNTADTQVILIESLKTGELNPLQFQDKAAEFGVETGILQREITSRVSVPLDDTSLLQWTKPIDGAAVSVADGILRLDTGGEAKIPVSLPFSINENIVLEFEARVSREAAEEWTAPPPPPGPSIPDPGSVSLEDARVQNLPSEPIIPAWDAPKKPEIISDTRFVYLQNGNETIPLPEISDSEAFKTVRISLSDFTGNVDAINIRNRDSLRDLEIQNIRIYDPTVRGDYKPVNPLSEARNAVLEIDGIEVRRDSNTISDIIPGATVTLHRESPQEVNLAVEPDREGIKNSIIEFVYHYNRLLTELNILTRNNESIVEEITYFSEEERDAALERLGIMQGDSSLRMMQSSLQTALMNAYPASSDGSISLLHQIGISTNTQGASASFNASRLRGYLELNESVFDDALNNNLQAVKKLFGSDSDGDMVVDTGVAHAVDSLVRPYVRTGGFIATRVATIEGQVERTTEDISSYNRHLEDYEQQLKEEFGRMEGALDSLEESSRTLDSFRQNSGN